MDTALVTFMVRTSVSTRSVDLLGSWDNFTKHYHMEPDSRQVRGQWRGCHQFEDIICDGDGLSGSKRTGGLKMGSRYYYYYELDGGIEYYDATMPFTTSCPYLPGQPINFIWVPIEVPSLRDGSASMSSLRSEDLKTMNPRDKYQNLRSRSTPTALPRSSTSTSILHNIKYCKSLTPQKTLPPSLHVQSKKKILPNFSYKCHESEMDTQLQKKSLRSPLGHLVTLPAKDNCTPRTIPIPNLPLKELQQKSRFTNLFPKTSMKTKKSSRSITSFSSDFCPSSSSTSSSTLSSLNNRNSLVSIRSQFSLPVANIEDLSYTSYYLNPGDFSIQNKTNTNQTDCYCLSTSEYYSKEITVKDMSWKKEKRVDPKIHDRISVPDRDCVKEGVSSLDSLRIEVGYLSDLIVA